MKRNRHIILISALAASVVLAGVVWKPESNRRAAIAQRAKQATAKTKATFQPFDLTEISVVKSKGKVQINIPVYGGDPPIPTLRVLSTVLQNEKTSNVFVLSSGIALGGTNVTDILIYNRKMQTLVSQSTKGMSSVGVIVTRKVTCQKVTDALLFKLFTRKPEATYWDLGSACSVVKPSKKQAKKNSKNFLKRP